MRIPTILLVFAGLSTPLPDTPHHAPPTQDPVADGRAATVLDRQGFATVRPAGRTRWTPLAPRDVVLPGDVIRTGTSGAHALELELTGGGNLLLGPGTSVEVRGDDDVRLLSGTVEVQPDEDPVRVRGPGGFERAATGRLVARTRDGGTATLDDDPRWLTGYRGSTTAEWMGSLIAEVDGRDVPLSIGTHNADVVVRDRIARTTIEQTFVNHTDEVLEGVFHFPVPAGASVSGFGVWIDGELVEADIVERQRARQIYEELKKRRKDPGLLEWEAGNVFKASIYPIPENGRKRIRIRYTQVLPLEGDRVRYRHPLRSDLLSRKALEELRIDVTVASTAAIEDLRSTTHEAVVHGDDHGGRVQVEARDFRSDGDFEVTWKVADPAPLTFVRHERDGDGWFLCMVQPPGAEGDGWQRTLTPDGEPVEVIVVADTSGSMDPGQRAAQKAFVGSLLALLGPEDRFRLMTCDVGPRWLADEALAAGDDARARALQFLDARASLGWTDLEAAFESVTGVAGEGAMVVYVGDGIGTAGPGDTAARARRLEQLASAAGVPCHAVASGTARETLTLRALARGSGGTTRTLGTSPGADALALLREGLAPALRGAELTVTGLRTARVHPTPLPDLPLGQQQIVLGRYLPDPAGEGGATEAVLTLRGRRGGEPVELERRVTVDPADEGNSFLPRLWAAREIGALRREGAPARERIIELSKRHRITTPYTSLLVVKDEELRREFGLERRITASDGERYFAAGREQGRTAARREAMTEARSWRQRLRAQALQEIAGLGRDLHAWDLSLGIGPIGGREVTGWAGGGRSQAGYPGRFGGRAGQAQRDAGLPPSEAARAVEDSYEGARPRRGRPAATPGLAGPATPGPATPGPALDFETISANDRRAERRRTAGSELKKSLSPGPTTAVPDFGFPSLPEAPSPDTWRPAPDWPEEIRNALAALDRRDGLVEGDTALHLTDTVHDLDPHSGRVRGVVEREGVWRPGRWSTRTSGPLRATRFDWLADGERGTLDASQGLGRTRPAGGDEGERFAWPLADGTGVDYLRTHRHWSARIAGREDGRLVVVLAAPLERRSLELTIDTERAVLLERVERHDGRTMSSLRCRDFTELAGQTWARRIDRIDDEGRTVRTIRRSVAAADEQAFADAGEALATARKDALVVPAQWPDLDTARDAHFRGEATLADTLRLIGHAVTREQRDRVLALWMPVLTSGTHRRGHDWISLHIVRQVRAPALRAEAVGPIRNGTAEGADRAFRAFALLRLVDDALSTGEELGLLETLAPAFTQEGPAAAEITRRVTAMRAERLEQLGRRREALDLRRGLAGTHTDELDVQLALAAALRGLGRHDDARAHLQAQLGRNVWGRGARHRLFVTLTDVQWQQRDLEALAATTARWIAEPEPLQAAWIRHHSVQMFRGRVGEADRATAAVLTEPGDLTSHARRQRIAAALALTGGNGWHVRRGGVRAEAAERLLPALRRLTRTAHGQELAAPILSDWRFRRTDAWRRLQRELRHRLLEEGAIADMEWTVLDGILGRVEWGSAEAAEIWTAVAEGLRARWNTAGTVQEIAGLGRHLVGLFAARDRDDLARAFLRAWVARGGESTPMAAGLLLSNLEQEGWSESLEEEMFGLVDDLPRAWADAGARDRIAAAAGRRLADSLLRLRVRAGLGPVAELETLPRAERRHREREARQAARAGLAAAFAARAGEAPRWQRPWLRLEGAGFAAESGAREEAWQTAEALITAAHERSPDEHRDRILRERASLVLARVAVDEDADPARIEDALTRYRTEARGHAGDLDWRYQTARLLLALGHDDELRGRLSEWTTPGELARPWRVLAAMLAAEEGRLEEAVDRLRPVREATILEPGHWQHLADWHLVLGDDGARTRARRERFAAMTSRELYRHLYSEYARLSRNDAAARQIDPGILDGLRSYLARTERPGLQSWLVRGLYERTRDFRIPATLAHGVLDHGPGAMLEFVEEAASVIGKVHGEADLVAIAEALGAMRERADTASERRGIGLLTFLVEGRAARVSPSATAHAEAAARALTAAVEGGFRAGERRRLAALLAGIEELPPGAAGDAVRRVAATLHEGAPRGSVDEAWCARHRARVERATGDPAAALDVLTDALHVRARHAAEDWTAADTALVDGMLARGTGQRAFARCEQVLRDQLDRRGPAAATVVDDRLARLYARALEHGGSLSPGRGTELYDAARETLSRRLEGPADDLEARIRRFVELHVAAKKAGIDRRPVADLTAFAHGAMAGMLRRLPARHPDAVEDLAEALVGMDAPRAALEVLVHRTETEPAWHGRVGNDGWQEFAREMGRYRRRIGPLHDALGDRLAAIVAEGLREHLETGDSTGRSFWQAEHRDSWMARRETWRTTVRGMLEEFPDDHAIQSRCVTTLWEHLRARDEAIAALERLHRRSPLDHDLRLRLARWLQEVGRHGDALPHLQELIEQAPDQLGPRTALVVTLARLDRVGDARALVAGTEERWQQREQWGEGVQRALAGVCLEASLHEEAVRLFGLAIRARERHTPGGADAQLAEDHRRRARAFRALGRFPEAIDEAAAAVVAAGSSRSRRREAMAALNEIVSGIPDLAAYGREYEREVEETGMDAPLLRKAVAKAFADRGEPARARRWFEQALGLQPGDREALQGIVTTSDRLGEPAAACRALERALLANPRDYETMAELARRYVAMEEPVAAERAATTMAEMEPEAATGHQHLARWRERQGRWDAAAVQWHQVVEARGFDAQGWFALAKAQRRAGEHQAARRTLEEMLRRSWGADTPAVHDRVRQALAN